MQAVGVQFSLDLISNQVGRVFKFALEFDEVSNFDHLVSNYIRISHHIRFKLFNFRSFLYFRYKLDSMRQFWIDMDLSQSQVGLDSY